MKGLSFLTKQPFYTKVSDLSPHLLEAQYAVRGLLPQTAEIIKQELRKGCGNYPFDEVIELNIGNPQTFGQKPLTFNRQVLATMISPSLAQYVHPDVKRRAEFYQDSIGYSIGAYSEALGYWFVRKAITDFIQKRDQTESKPSIDDIYITDGASQAIHQIMLALIQSHDEGVMIPIPQYPLYSALISLNGAQKIKYYLDEESGWSCQMEELERQYHQAKQNGIKPKLIVAINPGNPTGQILDRQSIENFIKFAHKYELTILADEVYQENIYVDDKKFISFRKVKEEMPAPYNEAELFSFHSISKGITGECGFRGGYVQMSSIDNDVFQELLRQKIMLIETNTAGQIQLGLMVTPPNKEEGCSDETIQSYQQEKKDLFESLRRRAEMTTDLLNSIKGISSQRTEGAMYAFPKIELSQKFVQEAKDNGFEQADVYYCMRALKETGLVTVPGSGFQQVPGTYHFRMTILIRPEEKLLSKLKTFKEWHEKLMKSY